MRIKNTRTSRTPSVLREVAAAVERHRATVHPVPAQLEAVVATAPK
jgi:hypothetical protein